MAKMTIAQCKAEAFQLINHYSIAGSVVPMSYNDQADDDMRMLNLINDAQMAIATTVKPIDASYEFTVPRLQRGEKPAELEFPMPEDFIFATGVLFKEPDDLRWKKMFGKTMGADFYHWLNDNTLLVPNYIPGSYRVEYARYPERYDSTTSVDTELDNTPDTHTAIPYYVAAMLYLDTNSYAYASLYNVWETKLTRLGYKPANAVTEGIVDMYGFDDFRGTWR